MGDIDMALDAALLEFHIVLRECACLVCEHILHLRAAHTLDMRGKAAAAVPWLHIWHLLVELGLPPFRWTAQGPAIKGQERTDSW